eukprot:589379-Rhodomonas_salina.4
MSARANSTARDWSITSFRADTIHLLAEKVNVAFPEKLAAISTTSVLDNTHRGLQTLPSPWRRWWAAAAESHRTGVSTRHWDRSDGR